MTMAKWKAVFATLLLMAASVPATAGERIGVSTADAPQLQGEFVVHNPTNMNMIYEVQWGSHGQWTRYAIGPRQQRRHWHSLDGNGRAPSPYLRFDTRANDRQVTWKRYDIDFGRVGYSGFGPRGNINEALHYEFTARGNALDLVRR
ncbi:MAG TPA: hypothetical protein VKF40_28410 [Burkholderiales bacterium]|nr:hypothetical protein [Burkholderiales bacterium]